MKSILVALVVCLPLGGCLGLGVPDMEEFHEPPGDERFLENIIINHVKCELRQGLEQIEQDVLYGGHKVDWLKGYGAKVTLKITADEKSSLNPSLTVTDTFQNAVKRFPVNGNVTSGQSFVTGLGGSLSANVTRSESVGFTYDFKSLMRDVRIVEKCPNTDGLQINSDLKIGDFMRNKVFLARVPGTTYPSGTDSPFNVFSYEATFISSYSGSVTPTWKFIRIGASGSPFFNAARTKTHYLTITLGPVAARRGEPPLLFPSAQEVHSINLIGQSVANAIASQQR
jgi:hypothetical protein